MSIITITDSFVPFVTTTSCYDNAFMYRNLLNPFHLINMLLINRSAKSIYVLNILFYVIVSLIIIHDILLYQYHMINLEGKKIESDEWGEFYS